MPSFLLNVLGLKWMFFFFFAFFFCICGRFLESPELSQLLEIFCKLPNHSKFLLFSMCFAFLEFGLGFPILSMSFFCPFIRHTH